MNTERLLKIKSQIDNAKSEQSEVAGQIKSTDDQIERRFDVKGLKKAKKKLNEIGDNLDNKETEFKKESQELEDAYEWD